MQRKRLVDLEKMPFILVFIPDIGRKPELARKVSNCESILQMQGRKGRQKMFSHWHDIVREEN